MAVFLWYGKCSVTQVAETVIVFVHGLCYWMLKDVDWYGIWGGKFCRIIKAKKTSCHIQPNSFFYMLYHTQSDGRNGRTDSSDENIQENVIQWLETRRQQMWDKLQSFSVAKSFPLKKWNFKWRYCCNNHIPSRQDRDFRAAIDAFADIIVVKKERRHKMKQNEETNGSWTE